jgi:hypothetical protein
VAVSIVLLLWLVLTFAQRISHPNRSCRCKQTKNPEGLCDGSHKQLPEDAAGKLFPPGLCSAACKAAGA